jgi:hypothetical protein
MLLNSLGRVLVASGLVAVTSFMASTAAFAGSLDRYIRLSGDVDSTLTFNVGAPFPLNLAGLATESVVSPLDYSTNAKGLKVTVGAAGAPLELTSTVSASPSIPYELAVGTSVAASTEPYVASTGGTLFQTNDPNLASATTYLFIKARGATVPLYPGTYWQDITLTATDK